MESKLITRKKKPWQRKKEIKPYEYTLFTPDLTENTAKNRAHWVGMFWAMQRDEAKAKFSFGHGYDKKSHRLKYIIKMIRLNS